MQQTEQTDQQQDGFYYEPELRIWGVAVYVEKEKIMQNKTSRQDRSISLTSKNEDLAALHACGDNVPGMQKKRRPQEGRLQWGGGLDLNSLACSAWMEMRSPGEDEYAGTRARAVHASGEPSAIWGVLEMDEQGTTGRWGGDGLNLGEVVDGTSLWLARAHSQPQLSLLVGVV